MYWNEAPDPKQNKTQLAGIIWKPTHFFINEEFVSALYNMLVVGVDALYTLFLKDSLLICYICLPHREFDLTTVFFVSNHNPKVIFLKQQQSKRIWLFPSLVLLTTWRQIHFKDNAREIEIACSFCTAQSYIHFSIINYYFKPYLSLV